MRRVSHAQITPVRQRYANYSFNKHPSNITQQSNQLKIFSVSKSFQHTAATVQNTGASSIFDEAEAATQQTQKKKKRRTDRNALKRYLKQQEAQWPTAKARVNEIAIAPKKLNRVARFIRGLSAKEAMGQLRFLNKGCAVDVSKCLKSAMFNAENNFGLNSDRLIVKEAYVGKAKYLKRMRFHGRARFGIMNRYRSKLTIIVQEVPERDNEKRLGRAGWTNKTWLRHEEQSAAQEQQTEQEKQKQKSASDQDVSSSQAASSAMEESSGKETEIPNPQMAQDLTNQYSPSVDDMLHSVEDIEAELKKDQNETETSQDNKNESKLEEEKEEEEKEEPLQQQQQKEDDSTSGNETTENQFEDEEAEVVDKNERNKNE